MRLRVEIQAMIPLRDLNPTRRALVMTIALIVINNIEDRLGVVRFTIFYLISGLAAAATQIAINPASRLPMIGASGAIAGVLGAYVVLYPRARSDSGVYLPLRRLD